MKIQEMRVTPIAIADPPLRNAAGLHAPYALRKKRLERVKFQLLKLTYTFCDYGQVVVAVHLHIAMTWEMLCTGHHTLIL